MSIKATPIVTSTTLEYNYFQSHKHSTWMCGDYVTHDADIYNTIEINGLPLIAVYQDSQSWYHNDYSCPRDVAELSSAGGTSKILLIVNAMCESDFDDADAVQYYLDEIDSEHINTSADLWALYQELMDNNSRAKQFYNELFNEDFEPNFFEMCV